jgi:hypothetical protein
MGAKLPLLAVVFAAIAPAWATAAGATASITRFVVEVTDLAPYDGVDARANFPGPNSSWVQTKLVDSKGVPARSYSHDAREPLESNASILSYPWASASSVIDALGQGYHLVATGATAAGAKSGAFLTEASFLVPVPLTPRTSITWRGEYALMAWAERDAEAGRPRSAQALFTFGPQGGTSTFTARANSHGVVNGYRTGKFSFTLTNPTDQPVVLNGMLAVRTQASSAQAAVSVP